MATRAIERHVVNGRHSPESTGPVVSSGLAQLVARVDAVDGRDGAGERPAPLVARNAADVEYPLEPVSGTEAYLAEIARAHTCLVTAMGEAGKHLSNASGTLPAVAARHQRLVQQVMDAHRAVLRHRAEVDHELQRHSRDVEAGVAVESADPEHDDMQFIRLRRVLDAWWWSEVADAERRLAQAVAPTGHQEPHSSVVTAESQDWIGGGTAVRTATALPPAIAELLASHDGGSLHTLLDELISSLPAEAQDALEAQHLEAVDPAACVGGRDSNPGSDDEDLRFAEWIEESHALPSAMPRRKWLALR